MLYITSYDTEKTAQFGIGGKAKNLFELKKLVINVPKWIVIPQEVFLEKLPNDLKENFDSEKIKTFIKSIEISELIAPALEHFGDDAENKFYAVRSSAIDEDGTDFSFAGQFETFLYVKPEEIETKIKKVWESAFSERVIKYRKKNSLKQQIGIAIIVQEMR